MPPRQMADKIASLNILVADCNQYMRRLTRAMLMNLGARMVNEAGDGLAAVDAIRILDPDIMFLEWDLPLLDGIEVIRIVRSPGVFPRPNLPIIMLTSRAERSSVMHALRVGVHEFLTKPTSPKAVHDRLCSILLKPRPMVNLGDYYVPEPRHFPIATRFGLALSG
jgi:two-component system, chemotaxis family, chemotaxis protein CheY